MQTSSDWAKIALAQNREAVKWWHIVDEDVDLILESRHRGIYISDTKQVILVNQPLWQRDLFGKAKSNELSIDL